MCPPLRGELNPDGSSCDPNITPKPQTDILWPEGPRRLVALVFGMCFHGCPNDPPSVNQLSMDPIL